MAAPNLIALLVLSGVLLKEKNGYLSGLGKQAIKDKGVPS